MAKFVKVDGININIDHIVSYEKGDLFSKSTIYLIDGRKLAVPRWVIYDIEQKSK